MKNIKRIFVFLFALLTSFASLFSGSNQSLSDRAEIPSWNYTKQITTHYFNSGRRSKYKPNHYR